MERDSANAPQAAYWNEIGGPHWVEQQHQFDRMLAAFGARALEALQPTAGERVLDIGCGTGTSSLALSEAVGPTGEVLGCDIAPTMIAAARARCAAIDGLASSQLSFAVLDAQTDVLGSADRPFDAVFSRFGVMFFSDPAAAFANVARHVRRGGRMAFACWQSEERNEWIAVPARVMRGFMPNPVSPQPNAPGPFAFGNLARVDEVLLAGNWTNVNIESFTASTELGAGLGLEAALRQTMGTRAAQDLRVQVDDATFQAATAAVRAALGEHLVDGAVVFDGNVWVVTAAVS